MKFELQNLNNAAGAASNLDVYQSRLEHLSKIVIDGNAWIEGDRWGFGAGKHAELSGKFYRWASIVKLMEEKYHRDYGSVQMLS